NYNAEDESAIGSLFNAVNVDTKYCRTAVLTGRVALLIAHGAHGVAHCRPKRLRKQFPLPTKIGGAKFGASLAESGAKPGNGAINSLQKRYNRRIRGVPTGVEQVDQLGLVFTRRKRQLDRIANYAEIARIR